MTNRARLAVVNQTLAREVGRGGPALDRTLEIDGVSHTVIGVVRDVRGTSLLRVSQGVMYVPFSPPTRSQPAAS